jgi:hypothetical protein
MDMMKEEKLHTTENGTDAYLDFVLWHYKVIDGLWFLCVADEIGQSKTEEIVEKVWGSAGEMAAGEIIKRFHITEKGLSGLVQALSLFPIARIVGYVMETKEDHMLLTVPRCAAQEARLRHGLGEFRCKEMHRDLFVRFARRIDPSIKVECLFAPPDPHPPDLFCTWIFRM